MKRLPTIALVALGATFAASSALAQPGAGGQAPRGAQAPGAQVPAPMSSEEAERATRDRRDRNFLENAAQGSFAEVEASKLALEKSESEDVKAFARKMVEDHEKMASDAVKLAQAKGATPPEGPSLMQKTEITALRALSGGPFDKMYVNRIGVAAHESTIEMFEKASQETRDPEVKALIDETLPKLREHLKMAQALNEKQDKE
jgi:putative membrane protein